MTTPLNQAEKDARLISRLKMDNSRLRNQVDKFMRNQGMSFESVLDDLQRFMREDNFSRGFSFSPTIKSPHKSRTSSAAKNDHSETAVLALSDTHFAERVRSEDVNGINIYNSVIGANRTFEVIDKFKYLVRLHEAMYPISDIVLAVLGDMVNGSIHTESLLTNDMLDTASVVFAANIIIFAIHELKTLGKPIKVVCSIGNHPRLLPQMPTKRQALLGYDWMIYEMVAMSFKGDEQVSVRVETGQITRLDIYGHRYVFEHGYDVKAGNEEQFESKLRGLFDSPIYREATNLKGSSVDMAVIGNMHQAKVGEGYIVNGCMVGQNELGMSWRLRPIGAIQQAWGVSKSHRMTWHYPIEVTRVISEKADNSFSEYAKGFMKQYGR